MMKTGRDVVIVSAARTPIGRFLGGLASIPAPQLGSIAIAEAVRRAGLDKDAVSEVIMGNVLSAGLGQAPARQAAIRAGLPHSVPATTVNKMCGSGLKAAMLATQAIALGDADIVVAGGFEGMSGAPYLLTKARTGYRLGNDRLIDSVLHDGLTDAYHQIHMGNCAEILAREYRISRIEQDDFARASYSRALAAMDDGRFGEEIVPVEVPQPKGEPVVIAEDEEPRRVDFEKLGKLRPAFEENGTVTVANSSSNSDGAAAVVLAAADVAASLGLRPLARVVGYAGAAMAPEWFTIAPAHATRALLEKIGWTKDDVDLYEINEAFAAVVIGVSRDLGISADRVNVHGGAVAMGHPVGASGARILTTLLYAMPRYEARRGIAAICLAGGEAVAMAVERL
jgi:acetyl-CoA C-acetyltransferase